MQATRRRDTAPEIALRRELHDMGLRYRVDALLLPGSRRRGDVVFTRARVVVFIDGCWWHGCPTHRTIAKTNTAWWELKLANNVRRDRDTDDRLQESGWTVIRVWEHEDPRTAAEAVFAAVRRGLRREPGN